MTATAAPIYRRKLADRLEAIRPFIGRRCTVRYSPGRNDVIRELEGNILGAAHHATNGTSTGELVISGAWTVAGNPFEAVVVGLSTLIDITPKG